MAEVYQLKHLNIDRKSEFATGTEFSGLNFRISEKTKTNAAQEEIAIYMKSTA